MCVFWQAHCPVYLVSVSSMAAGDVVATAKMQGNIYFLITMTRIFLKQIL